ncbi:hypothetical protein T07_10837 [Trichinella nelsoni]|uniref:Uncharacterized protein n=1 Tax=Trichinella nelsoni TaxID=6336 RepID=A0A0V0RHF2_9BILA|nr:hypothetical protein T07_10837 [Trichinella nelsoni]
MICSNLSRMESCRPYARMLRRLRKRLFSLVHRPIDRRRLKLRNPSEMLRILSPLKQRNTESTRQTIKRQLKPFHPLLKHFRGHTVQVLGATFLTVEYGFFNRPLHALVVKGRRYSLLGRNWFEPLDIRLVRMRNVTPNSIENLIEEYAELFSSTLDTVKGPPVVLHIGGSVPPINRAFKSWSYRMACYKAFDLLRTNFT